MSPKNPQHPPIPLSLGTGDLSTYSGPLWRVHRVRGRHRSAWNALRDYGPLHQSRWDPHPEPVGRHPGVGVSYTGTDFQTAFVEMFQSRRAITLTDEQALTAWTPQRPLTLLDLIADGWALRHGASASLPNAGKSTCRNWARAIYAELGGQIDGISVPSTMTGTSMAVLFSPAADAFPPAPAFSRILAHPAVETLALAVSEQVDWPIR